MLKNLQALRAYAALSVVFFHFSLVPASAMPWHFGSFGVDLFFVLSGFIIAYSAERDSRHFLAHRLIRVLPAYWIVTTLGAAMCLLAMPAAAALGWWGQSLLFLTSPEGRPPIIFVGWTLVYELAFYLIYSAALTTGRKTAPFAAIAMLLALAFALPLASPALSGTLPAASAVLRPWPLLIEFAFGLLIFLITKPVKEGGPMLRGAGVALLVLGLVLIHVFDSSARGDVSLAQEYRRVPALGIPAALTVLGLVLLEIGGWALKNRIVLALGAASYAMYLLHPLVFAMVLGLKPGPFPEHVKIFAILTVVTVLLSLGFYYALEAPLLRLLRRRFTHDAPPVVQRTA